MFILVDGANINMLIILMSITICMERGKHQNAYYFPPISQFTVGVFMDFRLC